MACPLCNQRKGRRDCPALRATICPICCGTKRLVEIDCPGDCVHLTSAREHPAAMVRRKQEQDVAVLVPTIRHLTERQQQLFFLFLTTIERYTPEGFARLTDEDVADAVDTAAKTLETTAKGVIYDHPARTQLGQVLARQLLALIAEVRQQGTRVYDGEAAAALRAIEAGARDARTQPGSGDTAYLELVRRLLQTGRAATRKSDAARQESGLILP
jgi:hypothetical protein